MRSLFILIAIAFIPASVLPKDDQELGYFPINEGSVWEYSKGSDSLGKEIQFVVRCTKVTKEKEYLAAEMEETMFGLDFGKSTIRISEKEIIGVKDFAKTEVKTTLWKKGAKQGDTWEDIITLKGIIKEGKDVIIRAKTTVGGMEEVTVPAGKFQARTLITTVGEYDPKSQKEGKTTESKCWLVEGVGMVRTEPVMSKEEKAKGAKPQITELKKYTPGK